MNQKSWLMILVDLLLLLAKACDKGYEHCRCWYSLACIVWCHLIGLIIDISQKSGSQSTLNYWANRSSDSSVLGYVVDLLWIALSHEGPLRCSRFHFAIQILEAPIAESCLHLFGCPWSVISFGRVKFIEALLSTRIILVIDCVFVLWYSFILLGSISF